MIVAEIEGQDRLRRLIVRPVLVVNPESCRAIGVVLTRHRYDVKDKLQSALSEMTYEEVRTAEGVQAAKKKLETVFNSFLVTKQAPRVNGVLFDEWLVR